MEETVTISKEAHKIFLDQEQKIIFLQQQLDELKRLIFGSKRERFVSVADDQASLFDFGPQQQEVLSKREQITYERAKAEKKKPVRLFLPSHLERRKEIIEPKDVPADAKKIGDEVTEILEYTPGSLFVRAIIRPKFALAQDKGIVIAELPSLPIPKSNAGASVLSHIIVSKFVDHLPFYRQLKQFKRQDVVVAESTIGDWFNQGCHLLEPLYDTLVKNIRSQNYLQADESPIKVQDNHKKGTTHTGFMWVYHSPQTKQVCFDYRSSRSREGPEVFLESFEGTLQTDGYTAYNKLAQQGKITLTACMAHARRKFDKALDNDKARAEYVLALMQQLYAAEAKARDENLSHHQRYELRLQISKPLVDELELWLRENILQVLPKSSIGMAITYSLNLWPRLKKYLDEGKLEIDNNRIENTIRPLALGRKNYLFAGSHSAAQRAAMAYSLMGTCLLNGVEPFSWLTKTFEVLRETKTSQLHTLLPGFSEKEST